MPLFANEATWVRAQSSSEALEKFHRSYEEALKEVRKNLGQERSMRIGGKDVGSSSVFADLNPSNTSEVVAYFPKGNSTHVNEAVREARRAQPSWEKVGWERRAEILENAARILSERKFELAAWMTLENGKNRVEAIYDVDEAIDFLRFYSQEVRRTGGYAERLPSPYPDEISSSVLRPWGVFAVVGPFNFPLAIPTGMTAGAIVTGNTAVLKPASDTPLLSRLLVEILEEAGVPPGVVNLVTGSGEEVGRPLLSHPGVDGLVFTGSKEVGMSSYVSFVSSRPRPCICEMGGKNAVIVTPSADLDAASEGIVKGAFGFGGQKCSAVSRLYVHEDVKEELLQRIVERTEALVVGPPEARDNGIGPLINESAVRRFEGAVFSARRDGGRILVGGRRKTEGALARGYFVEPTVVDGLVPPHEAFRVEYFVPFLPVAPYRTFEEVLEEVNATDYGLTSGIFSRNPEEISEFFEKVQAGVLYANRRRSATTGAMVHAQPFGGWKFSTTTGRGAGGRHYLLQFLREQSRTLVGRLFDRRILDLG